MASGAAGAKALRLVLGLFRVAQNWCAGKEVSEGDSGHRCSQRGKEGSDYMGLFTIWGKVHSLFLVK